MFRFHKTLDIVTLFHRAGNPASQKVANLLKQVSANSSSNATIDQASDHTAQTSSKRAEDFELDITEEPPTADQVKTILEYVGPSKFASIVNGATDEMDALKKFHMDPDAFQRPVVVDWNNGKAIANGNKSEIIEMLNNLNKSKKA